MAGPGGYRPGSGAKKGQHRIHVAELKAAMEKHLGMPYQEMLAMTQKKLFIDFQNDLNVKEYVIFTENMSKRLLAQPETEINITNEVSTLTDEQLQLAISLSLKKHQEAQTEQPADPEDTDTDHG